MVAGLIRLGAYGREDVFLTQDPQITFFKIVYHKHTSFSVETVEYTIPYSGLQFSKRFTHTPFYWGDMLSGVILKIQLPPVPPQTTRDGVSVLYNWVDRVGLAILKTADVLVGDRVVQRLDREWLQAWYSLTGGFYRQRDKRNGNTQKGLDVCLGSVSQLTTPQESLPSYTLHIPIPFWFTQSFSQVLPLTALNLGEVRIRVELESLENCLQYGPTHKFPVSTVPLFQSYSTIFQLSSSASKESSGRYYFYDASQQMIYYTPSDLVYSFQAPSTDSVSVSTQQFREKFFRFPLSSLSNSTPNGVVGGMIWDKDGNCCAPLSGGVATAIGAQFPSVDTIPLKGSFILDYVLLDEQDRLFFYNRPQEYVIEQVQKTVVPVLQSGVTRVSLGFYNPVSELIWGLRNQSELGFAITSSRLYLNSDNVLEGLPDTAPSKTLIGECHPNTSANGFNVFSFSLNPEETAPAGACNLSQIDQVSLEVVLRGRPGARSAMVVFAKSFNILRINGGVGWVLFQHN